MFHFSKEMWQKSIRQMYQLLTDLKFWQVLLENSEGSPSSLTELAGLNYTRTGMDES